MATSSEVVITGLGPVSPIGIGREAFSESLRARTSGVDIVERFVECGRPVQIGAALKDFQPKLYVKPRKSLKVMSHEIQMGVASATLAVEDAELKVDEIDVDRMGVVYGSPMLYADVSELTDLFLGCMVDGKFDFDRFGGQFPKQMIPLWMLKYLPNMTASHIGIAHGARGANNSVVEGDLSSLLAMIEAASVIERGLADVMLTGGSGSRLCLTSVTYRGDSNLSHRNDAPTAASRPFELERDGMVLGEGAGTIVLESRAHAERRGAPILGTVVSYARTHAGRDLNRGLTSAIKRSIVRCLEKGEVSPAEIGQVNAHGLSELQHDQWEADAIRDVLPDVPVTAVKSYFGNVGAASGALELSASLMSESVLPTLNYDKPDPACDINVSSNARLAGAGMLLKLNQNATGQAAAMLIRRE